LTVDVTRDLFELGDLDVGLEAEFVPGVVIDVDLGRLAIPRLPKLLLDIVLPSERLEHTNGTLRIDDALREARHDLLVAPPRTSCRQRWDRWMTWRSGFRAPFGLSAVLRTGLRF